MSGSGVRGPARARERTQKTTLFFSFPNGRLRWGPEAPRGVHARIEKSPLATCQNSLPSVYVSTESPQRRKIARFSLSLNLEFAVSRRATMNDRPNFLPPLPVNPHGQRPWAREEIVALLWLRPENGRPLDTQKQPEQVCSSQLLSRSLSHEGRILLKLSQIATVCQALERQKIKNNAALFWKTASIPLLNLLYSWRIFSCHRARMERLSTEVYPAF